MKVLIVEDTKTDQEVISSAVARCGLDFETTSNGRLGEAMLRTGRYDIAFIDIKLPHVNGRELLCQARKNNLKTFLIVLSSFTSEADKISAFALGADEFLAKPISVDELAVRVRAIVRRLKQEKTPEIIVAGDLVVNVDAQEVKRNGRIIRLTPKEKKMLVLLMRNKGRTVTTDMIAEYVWGEAVDPDSTAVPANISRLRKKLRIGDEDDVIHTVRDIGYVFK